MTIRTPVNLLSPKVFLIVATAILAGSVAACGSSASSTSAAATPAAATAAASAPPAATAAASAPAAATSPSSASAAATSPSSTSAAAAIAVTVPAWCINPRPVIPPGSLAEWLSSSGGYGYAQYVKADLIGLQANSTNATLMVVTGSLCQSVGFAKYSPPPVDVAYYTTALNDALKAALIVRNGSANPPARSAADPYISAATTALDAFFAAVGRPGGQ
jgi:hypothetical protein